MWAFRESLTNEGFVDDLFNQFKNYLESKELIFSAGQLVNASFTIAPRQRNTKEENEKIKTEKVMICATMSHTKNVIKILMLAGYKKIRKHFMDIKIMQRWIPKANL